MNWNEFINELIKKMGFDDFSLTLDEEHLHCSVFIHENENLIKDYAASLVENINKIIRLVDEKNKTKPVFVDVNNYRKDRERLIVELTKAAAKKAIVTKEDVSLPSMNSYERRIVHTELTSNPEVKTESQGRGKDRFVIIKPINKE